MICEKARKAAICRTVWLQGDWRRHVRALPDKSISLLLTDPPYGINYQSHRRKKLHRVLSGDGSSENAIKELSEMLRVIKPKLKADAHLLVFCSWRNEPEVRQVIAQAEYRVKGVIVWVKNNHGAGDLRGSFAPKHEWIIHAVKGNPRLYHRIANVIPSAKASSDLHPTRKPVDLIEKLIEATTVPGDLIADPFGGVATTLIAAQNCCRRGWGCEIEKRYYQAGKRLLFQVNKNGHSKLINQDIPNNIAPVE